MNCKVLFFSSISQVFSPLAASSHTLYQHWSLTSKSLVYVWFFFFSVFFLMIIQCLVLLRKIAGPSEESVYLYFLNGANLLKFCQKGAWPLLDWLNSKTSPCAMSSVTSYCPTLRGSCGGGYEGGVHLFTPRKAGAKRARKECKGVGGEEAAQGIKRKRKKQGRWIAKQETLSVMYLKQTQHHNTKSCFQRKQAQRHTKWASCVNIPAY